ncbi:MAG: heparinase II/III family protein [Spirochaetales bacterium]
MNKIAVRARRLFFTVAFLKVRQVVYRLVPSAAGALGGAGAGNTRLENPRFEVSPLPVRWEGIDSLSPPTVRFLNRTVSWPRRIDWSEERYGLLWLYHLHYCNWLRSPGLSDSDLKELLDDYAGRGVSVRAGRDPYPASLRIINLITFLTLRPKLRFREYENIVAADVGRLRSSVEYHISANHLLENGIALLWGGFFLRSARAWRKGKIIVLSQLREQILSDGAHFERSPMYHAIILWRVLDTINLLHGCGGSPEQTRIEGILRRYASRMLGWLSVFPWAETTGHLNDSARGMSPTRQELLSYGSRLGIERSNIELGESGYRLRESDSGLTMLADVGAIGPDYQPAHAHADTCSFELYDRGTPLIVDTGTSTYTAGRRRSFERSTAAHNTVEIGGLDSSEVWSAFRVARRAKVRIVEDTPSRLEATHDGYRSRLGVTHRRSWRTADNGFDICDSIEGRQATRYPCRARFIAAPGVAVCQTDERTVRVGTVTLHFPDCSDIRLADCEVACGFNRTLSSVAVEARFRGRLTTRIRKAM